MQNERELLHNFAHEFGGLHNIITGYCALLRAEALGPLTPEQKEAIDAIEQKTQQVQATVQQQIRKLEQ